MIKHLKRLGIFLSVLAIMSSVNIASAAQTSTSLASILAKGELVLGTSANMPPMTQLDKGGKPEGFDVDLASLVAQAMEVDLKVKTPKHGAGRGRGESPDSGPPRPTLGAPVEGDTEGEILVDRDGLKQVLRELLEEETLYGYPEMGSRWQGGTLVLNPGAEETQSKELPLDTFFHKIIMVRDRLRVLEAKINSNDKLGDGDKVELQSYISKCYGTLTTFNVLFRDKADQFTSK